MPARHRILVITRNLPPLVGGMEKLNQRLIEGLAEWADVAVIGPKGCAAHLPATVSVSEVPVRSLPAFGASAAFQAVLCARRWKPNFVVAGSGLSAPFAWLAARLSKARKVVYVHGLDLVVDSALYKALWLPFIRRADTVICNSRNTLAIAEACGVPGRRLNVVTPGVDVIEASPNRRAVARAHLGWEGSHVLLSVGRLTRRKGLVSFVEHVMPSLLRVHPELRLIVIGGEPKDALTGGGGSEQARIHAAAIKVGVDAHVQLMGQCDDAVLAMAMDAADLHVFPVIDVPGDVEGFGMVALEAAARGLPTIGYSVGGVPDAVEPGVSGELVDPGRPDLLREAILRWLTCLDEGLRKQCAGFARSRSWVVFNRDLRSAVE